MSTVAPLQELLCKEAAASQSHLENPQQTDFRREIATTGAGWRVLQELSRYHHISENTLRQCYPERINASREDIHASKALQVFRGIYTHMARKHQEIHGAESLPKSRALSSTCLEHWHWRLKKLLAERLPDIPIRQEILDLFDMQKLPRTDEESRAFLDWLINVMNAHFTIFFPTLISAQPPSAASWLLALIGQEIQSAPPIWAKTLLDVLIHSLTEKNLLYFLRTPADFNWGNPLHAAAYHGDQKALELLVKNGANLNLPNNMGQTPFQIAISEGNLGAAMLLIENGIEQTIPNQIALCNLAVSQGRLDIVELLIAKGISVNIQNSQGTTFLHMAVSSNNAELAMLLIEKGANLNLQDSQGKTPLHLALSSNNAELAMLLIEKGANLNLQDSQGNTPLHLALSSNNAELAMLLIEKGANLNLQDSQGNTPLHLALSSNNAELAMLLIKKGANPNPQKPQNCRYGQWKSTLYLASSKGITDVVSLLIEKGVDPACKDNSDALCVAAGNGHLDICQLLIKNGANPALRDFTGWTALHYATSTGHVNIVESMLKNGADPNFTIENSNGWLDHNNLKQTPLHLATSIHDLNPSMIQLLLKYRADVHLVDNEGRTPLHLVTLNSPNIEKQQDAIKLLVDRGALIDCQDHGGFTPLHSAVSNGSLNAAQQLIARKANLDIPDHVGWTPLHRAAYAGNPDMVQLLLDNNANPTCENDQGQIPLHPAAISNLFAKHNGNALTIARLLVEKGADPMHQDKRGWTPLHMATCMSFNDIVKFFLRQGADPTHRDHEGYSALEHLENSDDPELAMLLAPYLRARRRQTIAMASACLAAAALVTGLAISYISPHYSEES